MTNKLMTGLALAGVVFLGAGCLGRGETSRPQVPARVEERVEEKREDIKDAVINKVISAYDMIEVTNPLENQVVESPLLITGRARGVWYFEASFPIELYDANGVLLGSKVGEAQADWMTEEYVEFQSMLTFDEPTTETGTLVLKKDNPSGLPENDKKLEIPVRFVE